MVRQHLLTSLLPDFQLAYAYSQFIGERSAWRAVIHLNLVRSVNNILDVLSRELSRTSSQPQSPRPSSPSRSPRPSIARPNTSTGPTITTPSASTAHSSHKGASTVTGTTLTSREPLEPEMDLDPDDDPDDDEPYGPPSPLSDRHRMLQLRLAPLRQVQRDLERSLGTGSTEAPEYSGAAAPWERLDAAGRRQREFSVTSRTGWKTALRRVKSGYNAARRGSLGSREDAKADSVAQERRPVSASARVVACEWTDAGLVQRPRRGQIRPTSPFGICNEDDIDDELNGAEGEGEPQAQTAADVISSCAEDMATLWADPDVQAVLTRRKMSTRLEEGPGL